MKNMNLKLRRFICLPMYVLLVSTVWAQTPSSGVNTLNPDPSAVLHINATDKGLLIPRVTLSGLNDVTTVATPANGLLVFNTAAVGTAPLDVEVGFYYYSSAAALWVPLNVDNEFWIDKTSWITAATALTAQNSTDKVQIESGGSVSLDGSVLPDGFSSLLINNSTATTTVTFSNFTGAYDLNTVKSDITADGSFQLEYLESAIITVNEKSGSKYFNVNRFGRSNSALWDGDKDTGIQVEESIDEDIIRFDTAGVEHFTMNGPRLSVLNSGNSVFIGEGAGANDDLSTNNNVFIGRDAGNSNSVGTFNTAVGGNALYNNDIGHYNVANGFESLKFNRSGTHNVAVGFRTLFNNYAGIYNTAIGALALFGNNAGSRGVAFGYASQLNVNPTTTGWTNTNTSVGYESLRGGSNAVENTGLNNTAIGHQSLLNNTTGGNNTANGFYALLSNTTGDSNTANGYQSLLSNTVGRSNTAYGYQSLGSNISGNNNTAYGTLSLYGNTTGSFNTALGDFAGRYTNTGDENQTSTSSIYLGYDARSAASGSSNEIVIGTTARGLGTNTAVYGNSTMTKHIFTSGRVGVGVTAPEAEIDISGGLNVRGVLYGGALNAAYNFHIDSYDPVPNNGSRIFLNWHGGNGIIVGNGSASYGPVTASTYLTGSDERLKENIQSTHYGLESVLKMKVKDYNYKSDQNKTVRTGLIAQDLEKVFPGAVNVGTDEVDQDGNLTNPWSVDYSRLTPVIIKAMQEQQDIIAQQQKLIDKLIKEVEQLKNN